jgi:hypothetical protein
VDEEMPSPLSPEIVTLVKKKPEEWVAGGAAEAQLQSQSGPG